MNFDFGKFATLNASNVEDAFSSKPSEVVVDIANEIKKEEVKEELSVAEQIKQQAEFLKQQKEKSDNKEAKVEEKAKPKSKAKAKAKETPTPKEPPKPPEPIVYSKDRVVIAYGEEIYTETDVNASLEDIRNKLVNEYGYSEFKDENRCKMIFDAKTGDVYPEVVFNKKG